MCADSCQHIPLRRQTHHGCRDYVPADRLIHITETEQCVSLTKMHEKIRLALCALTCCTTDDVSHRSS
jgi:hypothetical protein